MGLSSSKSKPKKPVGNSDERRVSPEILAPAAATSGTQEASAALPVASAPSAVTAANKTESPITAEPAAKAASPAPPAVTAASKTESSTTAAPAAKDAPPASSAVSAASTTELRTAAAPDAKAAPPTQADDRRHPCPDDAAAAETALASAPEAASEVSALDKHASAPCAAEPAAPTAAVMCDTIVAAPAVDAATSQAAALSPATVEAAGPVDAPTDGTTENSGKTEVLGTHDRTDGDPLDSPSSIEIVAEPPADAELSEKTSQLLAAAEGEDWEGVAQILREAAVGECDPNVRTQDWGYSLLRAAAEEGAEEVCRLLVKHRADVNLQDKGGMTPLMGCAVGGDVPELVTLLLEARADAAVSTEDDQFTALRWATRLDRHETVKILRAAGMTGAATAF